MLVDFAPFTKYDRYDLDLNIEFYAADSLPKAHCDAAFELVKSNMYQHYLVSMPTLTVHLCAILPPC